MTAEEAKDGDAQELFYIQSLGYSGNFMSWWRSNCCGYTFDIREALKVTRKEAEQICADRPDADRKWLASYIDRLVSHAVSIETIR